MKQVDMGGNGFAALFFAGGGTMRVLMWVCRIFIFLFLLGFALRNTEPVTVRFFFDTAWQAPLVIIVLAFFAGGVALGALSMLGTVFRLRRENARLRREARIGDNKGLETLSRY